LTGTFGRIEIEVPRARLNGPGGKTTEWNSQVLRAYQRRTLAADALIASTYLAGLRSISNAACVQLFAISNNVWRCLSDLVSVARRK
jgi:hypothetical protein